MLRYALLFFCCCFIFSAAYAQQKLSGQVFENGTRVPLAGIRIQNNRSKLTTETDIKGHFTIDAKVNDVLIFTGFAYQPDSVFLTDIKPREIFLEPAKNMLKQVDVAGAEVHTGTLTDPEFHGQSAVYSRNGDGSYKGGVTFRVWSNHSAERKREKQARQQQDENMRLEIDRVFSAKNLAKYLPLKPEEVDGFRSRYMPTVKTYTANEFNLLLYLGNCYKEFMKLPVEKRVADKLVDQ
jgi:hypothetical protein